MGLPSAIDSDFASANGGLFWSCGGWELRLGRAASIRGGALAYGNAFEQHGSKIEPQRSLGQGERRLGPLAVGQPAY